MVIELYIATKSPPLLFKSRSRHSTSKYILISLRQVYRSTSVLFEISQSIAYVYRATGDLGGAERWGQDEVCSSVLSVALATHSKLVFTYGIRDNIGDYYI